MNEKPGTVSGRITDALQPPRIPRATYRIQFNPDFTFKDAQEQVDYLAQLGISHLYASPVFKPRSDSTHGYDIVDYNSFNPKLGSEDDFNALTDALKAQGIGMLLDIVPNHMGVNTENEWWMDVLKHGPSSVYAGYFDIDWRPQNRALDDKVLLPVLGDHYGRVLEAGELKVVYWHGDFYIHYYAHQFPITPETYIALLGPVLGRLDDASAEDWVGIELGSVVTALEHMPAYAIHNPKGLTVRRREQQVVRWRLLSLWDKSEPFRDALDAALLEFNGQVGNPTSFDRLDELLGRQPYRLAYWRTATDEINYRRFFDINDMAAIRIETPRVFDDTHRLTLRLLAEGRVGGLRIDHPDGLWNPQAYFWRLQEAYVLAKLAQAGPLEPDDKARIHDGLSELLAQGDQPARWPLYLVAEKILSTTEPLPYTWAVYGTTGYDFMNAVNNLFVDNAHEAEITRIFNDFIGQEMDFDNLIAHTKRLVMDESLTSEINARSAQLAAIVESNRRYRGFTRNSLAFAMSEFIAALSIYRTYITEKDEVGDRDRRYIEEATALAKVRNPLKPATVFDFLCELLLKENLEDFTPAQQAEIHEFVMKFQQITGPVMAKSVEDTAFYRFNRLVSLNEVGGHPKHFGGSVEDFHQHNREKAFPYTMLSTSTHDTKRSEDVRARINVLSELPDEWAEHLKKWAEMNAEAKSPVRGHLAPLPNDEYLLYQTMLGAYPEKGEGGEDFILRMARYMEKATNEAKLVSNWLNPHEEYAGAVEQFIKTIWDNKAFRGSFIKFQARLAWFGRFNSLAQVVLKLTSPGVPDIYQGMELWQTSLVDPDNRRPVDYALRGEMLGDLQKRGKKDLTGLAAELLAQPENSALKMFVTERVLGWRQTHENLACDGEYVPLEVTGEQAAHVCAYLRQDKQGVALVVVPRLIAGLLGGREVIPVGEVWGDVAVSLPGKLAAKSLRNVFTGAELEVKGKSVRLGDLLAVFPVGLWVGEK